MRISLFIQRGLICQRCGVEIDGEVTGAPRICTDCQELELANHREQRPLPLRPLVKALAARP